MVLANSKTHIEPLDTFHDAGAHDLDILLKGTIVYCNFYILKLRNKNQKKNYEWHCETNENQ